MSHIFTIAAVTLLKLAEKLHVPLMYLFNFGEDPVISNKAENNAILNILSELTLEKKQQLAIKILKVIGD